MCNLSKKAEGNRVPIVNQSIGINPIHRGFSLPFVAAIRIYRVFSPVKQFVLGPYARCRFHPTCSEYALECFRTLPLHRAIHHSLSRILKCNPMHPGGYDPVHPDCDKKPYSG
jgi:putative membrane protein insertion efficiency factor